MRKDALLMVPGAGLTLAEQMGLSDKSDRMLELMALEILNISGNRIHHSHDFSCLPT
jgi:hypothetical protein